MNLQSLVVVALRLMALNFLHLFVLIAVSRIPDFRRDFPVDWQGFIPLGLILTAIILSPVVLWVFALPIARFATRGVRQDLSFGTMSLTDCYSIAFMGIGLFYIASHLPKVLNWIHYVLKEAVSRPRELGPVVSQYGYNASEVFITFMFGLLLFVNGRRWAIILARRQSKGVFPNQDAAPNGGPAPSVDNPNAPGGPPSVS